MTERSKLERLDEGPEEPTRPWLPDEPAAMRTTLPCAGVLTSASGSFCSSNTASTLSWREPREEAVWTWEPDVERRFVVELPSWLRLCGVLLRRTTLFRRGLGSREGLEFLDERPSLGCELPARALRRVATAGPDAAAWRRVRGGDGARALEAVSSPPSLRRAFVRALSFIGTGISSSELSSSYWFD